MTLRKKTLGLSLAILVLFALQVGAAPLWELSMEESDQLPMGKLALVEAELPADGMRFKLSDLDISQPVQVVVVPLGDSDVTLEVFKDTWDEPLAQTVGTKKENGILQFRTGDFAAFQVTGQAGEGFQLMVWAGPVMNIPPPSPFIAMDVFMQENDGKEPKASQSPSEKDQQEASKDTDKSADGDDSDGDSDSEGRDPLLYALLGGIMVMLMIIAFAMLRKGRANMIAWLLFSMGLLSGGGWVNTAPEEITLPPEPQPRKLTPAETHDRISAAMNELRDRLTALGDTGNAQVDDMIGATKLLVGFMEHFGLIDPREAAVQPNYNPPGLPPLPSRCVQDYTGRCSTCFDEASTDLDKWRGLLEDQWVIYKQTMLKTGRIIELADAAAGLSPLAKLKWTVDKNNPNEGMNKSKVAFFASYDTNYTELIKRVNDALIAIGKCERDNFNDPDWYNRYGLPYYMFMRDRYLRK